MKLSTVANKVIALGEKIRDYWDRELPKRHPDYPIINPGEEPPPPPPEERKLRKLLESLPEDMLYTLVLLIYLGEGWFDTSHLADQYQALREKFDTFGAIHRIEVAALGGELSDGLEVLRQNNIDVDALTFTSVRSGSSGR